MNPQNPVRVRFAPSPTGHLHLGGARTALYNYLLAHQAGGSFILRIEDTDQKRYVEESEKELIDNLHWLGIQWDEGPDVGGPHAPYRQSLRRDIYQEYGRQLINSGHAYYCFCTPERLEQVRKEQMTRKENPRYDGLCRRLDPLEALRRVENGERHVVRFKVPESGSITANDLLRGDITVNNSAIDDHVIIKSDGLALYHLAAMVDDHLMEITHVIRGSEWISTFPLHVHIIRAFGWQEPQWVHLSVFLKPSGKGKLSKRDADQAIKDGHSIFIKDLASLGYIPEGVNNWMALMGWSYDDHTYYFTLQELIEKFSLQHLNPSPAAIDFTKLDYYNGLHIRNLAREDLAHRLTPYIVNAGYQLDEQILYNAVPVIRERLVTLDDVIPVAGFLFKEVISPDPNRLVVSGLTPAETTAMARNVYAILASLPQVSKDLAEPALRNYLDKSGLKAGQVFGFLREAAAGQKDSPPLFEIMEIIGRDKLLERIQSAITILEGM